MNKYCKIHGDTLEERFDNDMKIVLVCVHCQLDEANAELLRIHNAVEEQYVITHRISCERNHAHAQLDEARYLAVHRLAMYEQRESLIRDLQKACGVAERERDEARAELAKVWAMFTERAADNNALRAAIEAHNAKVRRHIGEGWHGTDYWLIPLPSAAAQYGTDDAFVCTPSPMPAAPEHKPTCAVFKGVGSMNYGEFITPPCDCAAPEVDENGVPQRFRDALKSQPRTAFQRYVDELPPITGEDNE